MINQVYEPREIIIVKDGLLTEELDNVIERFKLSAPKNIDIFLKELPENRGLGFALKEGTKMCTQKYIVRQDSDDISRIDRLKILKKYLDTNPDIDVLGTYIYEFTDDQKSGLVRKVPLSKQEITKYAYLRNPINHVSACIKRDFFDKFSYKSVLFHEDYFLWIEGINNNALFMNIPEITVDVRVGNDMISRRRGFSYLKHEINFLKKCYQYGYFSFLNCINYLSIRIVLRFLPTNLLKFVYNKVLRSSS